MSRFIIFPEFRNFLQHIIKADELLNQKKISKKTGISEQKISNYITGVTKSVKAKDWIELHKFLATHLRDRKMASNSTSSPKLNFIENLLFPRSDWAFLKLMIASIPPGPDQLRYFENRKGCPINTQFDVNELVSERYPNGEKEPMVPPLHIFNEAMEVARNDQTNENDTENKNMNKLVAIGCASLLCLRGDNSTPVHLADDNEVKEIFSREPIRKALEKYPRLLNVMSDFEVSFDEEAVSIIFDNNVAISCTRKEILKEIEEKHNNYLNQTNRLAKTVCSLLDVDDFCKYPTERWKVTPEDWQWCKYKLAPYIYLTKSVNKVLPNVVVEYRHELEVDMKDIEEKVPLYQQLHNELNQVINKFKLDSKNMLSDSISTAMNKFIMHSHKEALKSFIANKNDKDNQLTKFSKQIIQEVERLNLSFYIDGQVSSYRSRFSRDYKLPIEKLKDHVKSAVNPFYMKEEVIELIEETLAKDKFFS